MLDYDAFTIKWQFSTNYQSQIQIFASESFSLNCSGGALLRHVNFDASINLIRWKLLCNWEFRGLKRGNWGIKILGLGWLVSGEIRKVAIKIQLITSNFLIQQLHQLRQNIFTAWVKSTDANKVQVFFIPSNVRNCLTFRITSINRIIQIHSE